MEIGVKSSAIHGGLLNTPVNAAQCVPSEESILHLRDYLTEAMADVNAAFPDFKGGVEFDIHGYSGRIRVVVPPKPE